MNRVSRNTAMRFKVAFGILLLFTANSAFAGEAAVKRFGIFVGANNGGQDRIRLHYASSDAENMAMVMEELGGLSESSRIILLDPDSNTIQSAFNRIRSKMLADSSNVRRTEFMFYYSGHSDEQGLRIGQELISYKDLKERIFQINADVNVAILDSCASGTFTRLKGGQRAAPFLIDESSDVSGHAFLTSSSENEASQESDAIGGSFFTHYLISGLRGAADSSKDGRVTLNELYQYAHSETLARTAHTQAGPQNPSFDIQLNGKGELVLSDINDTAASIIFDDSVAGRLFIRNSSDVLIAEVNKQRGVQANIALPPGKYDIDMKQGSSSYTFEFQVYHGSTRLIRTGDFSYRELEETISRGGERIYDYEVFGGDEDLPIVPVAIMITPGLSTSPFEDAVQLTTLGLITADAYRSYGLMASAIMSITRDDSRGFMGAGIGNITEGEFSGVQYAGIFNITEGSLYGIQSGSIFNIAKGEVRGFQAASIFNTAEGNISGGQAAAIYNTAHNVGGVQIGTVNIAETVEGAQIGIVNIADEVHGPAIGLVNVIGNGIFDIGVWFEDNTERASLFMQTGSHDIYTILYMSADTSERFEKLQELTLGGGFGGRIRLGRWFYLDSDISSKQVFEAQSFKNPDNDKEHTPTLLSAFPSFRTTLGWQLGEGLGFFIGSSMDIYIPGVTPKNDEAHNSDAVNWVVKNDNVHFEIYPKFIVGAKF